MDDARLSTDADRIFNSGNRGTILLRAQGTDVSALRGPPATGDIPCDWDLQELRYSETSEHRSSRLQRSRLLVESIVLFIWLSKRMHEPLQVWSAVGKGLVAALIGGASLTAWQCSFPDPQY